MGVMLLVTVVLLRLPLVVLLLLLLLLAMATDAVVMPLITVVSLAVRWQEELLLEID